MRVVRRKGRDATQTEFLIGTNTPVLSLYGCDDKMKLRMWHSNLGCIKIRTISRGFPPYKIKIPHINILPKTLQVAGELIF